MSCLTEAQKKNLDEPAECLNCSLWLEAYNLNRYSLDAYADLEVDYDLFCPKCGSDDIKLHKPKEDRLRGKE